MARIPTNVRLFGEYLLGEESPITEKDFTPEELSEMLRLIEEQDKRNLEEEAKLKQSLGFAQKRLENFKPDLHLKTNEEGKLVPKYTQKEYNNKIQEEIRNIESKLATYEKTRNKTSVEYREERTDPAGLNIAEAVAQTFTSPAYNVETSLGHFNAFKNKDGTVTIKDEYDFLGYGHDESVKVSMSDFLKALPTAITRPEAFGTLLARAFFAKRKRDVDIDLGKKAKTAKTFTDAL